jgi:hypothetical protein
MTSIEGRVAIVAEAALADQRFVTPTDVLVGLGWLTPAGVGSWMKGNVSSLEDTFIRQIVVVTNTK